MERKKSVTPSSPHNFWDFDSKRKDDEMYVLERVSRNGSHLSKASKRLRRNKTIVEVAVKQNWYALHYASDSLKNDESICLEAISQDGYALKFAGDRLRKDKSFILSAVRKNGLSLKYAGTELRKDHAVVLEAVKQNGLALEFYSIPRGRLMNKTTHNIMMTAVSNNGMSLKFVPKEMKVSIDIVRKAVQQNGMSIEFASHSLQKNRELCYEAVLENGSVYKKFSDERIRNDRMICLEAVRNDPTVLKDIVEVHRNDREIVSTSVRSNGLMLGYANAKMRDDKEIVSMAVTNNGLALKFASRRLSYDREIVLTSIRNDGFALYYASKPPDKNEEESEGESDTQHPRHENLKNDFEVVSCAIENDPFSFKFASEELKKSKRKEGKVLLEKVIKNMTSFIETQKSMTHEEKNRQRQKVIETVSKRKSLPLIEEKRRRSLDKMYFDRGLVFMKYYRSSCSSESEYGYSFWEAYEDFILSLVEIDRKNFYSDHIIDNESFERVIEIISLTAQNIMIQQIQEDENWILKWTTPGIKRNKKNLKKKNSQSNMSFRNITSYYFFQRPMTEKEVEVKRKSICFDFVGKVVGPSLEVLRERWRNEAKKRILTRCRNTLIAWYGDYNQKVAYLGVLSPLTQTPLGHGFKFHISRKYRSSKLISSLKRNIYRLVYYGKFDEGGQRGGGQGREYDPSTNRLSYEGEFKFGKRWGKGREFSSNAFMGGGDEDVSDGSPENYSSVLDNNNNITLLTTTTTKRDRPLQYFVIFQGQYENGSRHGQGEFYDEETQEIVRGVWSKGVLKEIHSQFECPIIPFSSIEKHLRHECIVGRGSYGIIYMIESKHINRKYLTRRRKKDDDGFRRSRRKNINITTRRRKTQVFKKRRSFGNQQKKKVRKRHSFDHASKKRIENEEKIEDLKEEEEEEGENNNNNMNLIQFLDSEEYVAVKIFESSSNNDINEDHFDNIRKELMFRNIKYAIELCGSVKDKKHILDVKAIIKGRQIGYLFELARMSVDKIIVPSISSLSTTVTTTNQQHYHSMISLDEKFRILYETAKGMKSLHSQNIMHRDLKWGNILMNKNGVIKITDFDSAKEDFQTWKYELQPHTQGIEIGTLEFLAPEMILFGESKLGSKDPAYGIEVDIYSFGIMIYSLLYGFNNPFFQSYHYYLQNIEKFGGNPDDTTITCCSCGMEIRKIINISSSSKNSSNPLTLLHHISKCNLRPPLLLSSSSKSSSNEEKKEKKLMDLAILCWDEDPSKRPSFSTIVEFFKEDRRKSKTRYYSIVTVMIYHVFIIPEEEEQRDDYLLEEKKKKFSTSMKILLMKPTMKKLRKLVEKKKKMGRSSKEEEEEVRFEYFHRFKNEYKKIEIDEDVLEMVVMEENPEIHVFKIMYSEEEKEEVEEEQKQQQNIDETKNMMIIKNLRKEILELRNKNKRLEEEKETIGKNYLNFRSKIENVVLMEDKRVSNTTKTDNNINSNESLLDQLSQIIFEDLTSSSSM